jgi:peptidoglycan/LPS O-acetylase OafA/YrhL
MYFLLTSATFLVAAILLHQRGLHDLKIYLLNITFVRGFFNNLKFTGVAQGWSLTVEETFYFLAPLLFIFIKKNKYYLLTLPVIFVLIGLSIVYASSKISLGSFFETNYFMFGYTFFGRAFEFFIGISLAIFFKKFRDSFKTIWCTYTGLFIIFLCVFFLSMLKRTGNYQYGIEHPAGMVINNTLLPLFGIALFFWGLLTEKTFIRNFLSTKVMVLLGKSSYIFYLIHVGIFYQLITNYTSGLLMIFILLNIISVMLFKLVEEPLNLFIRKKLYGDRAK